MRSWPLLPALMAALLSLPAARCPLPAAAQTVTDGDTIKQGGVIYRLWGIDAPELRQAWPDGAVAQFE